MTQPSISPKDSTQLNSVLWTINATHLQALNALKLHQHPPKWKKLSCHDQVQSQVPTIQQLM